MKTLRASLSLYTSLRASLCAILLLSMSMVSAQRVSEGTREFVKGQNENALSLILQGQPKNVETVLAEQFRKATGDKGRPYKGLRAYEGVRYPAISSSQIDLYYRVEKADREDNQSRVILFLSAGNGNFMDSRKYDRETEAAIAILEALPLEVNIYEMGLVIAEQKKVVNKAVKDHERMVADSVSLQTQLAETLQAIEDNRTSRIGQLEKIAAEEQRLADFEQQLDALKNGGQPVLREEGDEDGEDEDDNK
ncbi:MAG: hypothetical protein OHK0039_37810 [Bacteroidia bacterium]